MWKDEARQALFNWPETGGEPRTHLLDILLRNNLNLTVPTYGPVEV
jgi:hypothetical protein